MGTVVALYENYTDAEKGMNMLVSRGFDRNSVSFAVQESAVAGRNGSTITNGENLHPNEFAEGFGEGAMVGGGAGLVAGIAALLIPGIGPLFVTGALASVVTSAVAGATAGAAVGGLGGALTEYGLPEDTTKAYVEGVKQGGVLLSVETDNMQQARDTLYESKATNIHNMTD